MGRVSDDAKVHLYQQPGFDQAGYQQPGYQQDPGFYPGFDPNQMGYQQPGP